MSSLSRHRVPPFPRHATDFFALFAGLLFAALGAGFLLDAADVWDADVTWVLPIVLIALGIGGIVATVTRSGEAPQGQEHEQEPDPDEMTG